MDVENNGLKCISCLQGLQSFKATHILTDRKRWDFIGKISAYPDGYVVLIGITSQA